MLEEYNQLLLSLGYPKASLPKYKFHPSYHHRNKRVEAFLKWICANVTKENLKPVSANMKALNPNIQAKVT
jgi:hypothetical protein